MPQSLEVLQAYWHDHRDDFSGSWLAIWLASERRHIGNIKLGLIHWLHGRAYSRLFIGEGRCWGQVFDSEPIALLCDWAFRELDLQKFNVGVYSGNFGSRWAFEKCGFELEGTLRLEVVSAGQRLDVSRLGLTRSNWSPPA